MNGEEALVRTSPTSNKFSYNQSRELTPEEMMDLTVFGAMPVSKTVYKVMEFAIADARDEAMECDPAHEATQRSLMTVAHAMDKFYKKVRGKIEFAQMEHLSDVKQKVLAEDMKDQERVEEIIMMNVQGKI